ncbi:OmpW family outer membrane protein [Luteimonas sp. RD2P54]|uniref:OmpW family outer membrane protein n=1 Tax=Luteimonas endophytica TaxID=3042023 RepID=A0ABT6J8F5_9GAMM|nr:OmpW family outer membrane protein [Luteimonas endophytica]MDH5822875.1 OmpW family outer membrane protein [Luteimonas endophytica]
MTRKTIPAFLAAALAAAALPAAAQSAGDWTLALGAHQVAPKSDNGALAGATLPLDIGNDVRPTFAVEYFLREGLGLEVLAALPFQHDISIDGLGRVGSTRHLPPTASLQYHFNRTGRVSPLLGVGVNYTRFFSEDTSGALAGTDLSLDDSWGLAAHAGLDLRIGERGSLRIDARWIDIDADATVDGADLGTAQIDPLVYGAAWVMRF